MSTKLSNIELAYQYLKDEKNGKSFADIWNAVASEINEPAEKTQKIRADLYADMVLDNRFALTADGLWATRSNMSAADVKKQKEQAYDFDFDADFDDLETDDEEDQEDVDNEDSDDSDEDEDDSDQDEEDDDDFVPNAEDSYDDDK